MLTHLILFYHILSLEQHHAGVYSHKNYDLEMQKLEKLLNTDNFFPILETEQILILSLSQNTKMFSDKSLSL